MTACVDTWKYEMTKTTTSAHLKSLWPDGGRVTITLPPAIQADMSSVNRKQKHDLSRSAFDHGLFYPYGHA